MRGKVTLQDVPCDSVGITPRVCGEKAEQIKKSSADTGSPPHVRGKGFFHFTHEMFEGITPACAGKSIIEATSRALNEDHPRVCGEKKPAGS